MKDSKSEQIFTFLYFYFIFVFIYLFIYLRQSLSLLPRLKWMAQSQLIASSASQVQAILLPQPPK